MFRLLKATVFALAAALIAAAAVGAVTMTVTSIVTASTLTVAAGTPPTFGVTLNGVDQTVNYTLPMIVIDARGGTLGWNLTVTSTTFNDGLGHTFPANASTITAATAVCGTNSTCLLPTNSVNDTSLPLPGASGAPVKYFNAALSTGRGTLNVDATVAVAIPANTFAGSFTSTVTVAISTGP